MNFRLEGGFSVERNAIQTSSDQNRTIRWPEVSMELAYRRDRALALLRRMLKWTDDWNRYEIEAIIKVLETGRDH